MTILEKETELGKCNAGLADSEKALPDGFEDCVVCAYTLASLSGSKHMLRIEHRCYLRLGDEILDQSFLKPELLIEPALGNEHELAALARKMHEDFVVKAKTDCPIAAPYGPPEDSAVA